MALLQPRDPGRSLWKSVSGVERPPTAEGIAPDLPSTVGEPDQSIRFSLVTERARVERVSIYPWENGETGKLVFRCALELDPKLDPTNRQRRTVTVTGLELEAEEKELVGLARLTGRKFDIHCLLPSVTVKVEALEDKIQDLQAENEKLRRELSRAEESLNLALDLRKRSV